MHAPGFFRYSGTSPVVEQTEAWVCADKKNLYVAFRCLDSQPQRMRVSETQRGGNLRNDDFVGIDIDSQNSRRNLSAFRVSARGTQSEEIEGGTADNITWAGDWKAATARTADGWTAEVAIPFGLLRYPRGARAMGILLFRHLARETALTCWPYLPPGGERAEEQYLDEFTGLDLPGFTPRPVFLPYALAVGGPKSEARQGLDIKYPLTTTLTGVAALRPDFQTIEQDVTDINFSYTEKFLEDHRPFFAEGRDYLPSRDLFYPNRIGEIDGGVKVVGKQNATTIGALAINRQGRENGQSAFVMNLRQDIGLLSKVEVAAVGDNRNGRASNRTGKLEGTYGWQSGQTRFSLTANHAPSWQNDAARDSSDFFSFRLRPQRGQLGGGLNFNDIGPRYVSDLGFVPEKNLRGGSLNLFQFNQFDKGKVEGYFASVNLSRYERHTGGFFHDGVVASGDLQMRSGWRFSLGHNIGKRFALKDNTQGAGVFWNTKTLFQQGGVDIVFGTQASQKYNFLNLSQGILITRAFSLQLNYQQVKLGDEKDTQTVATGTYRLSPTQTFGGRLVNGQGRSDVFFSFGQHVPSGTDIFILLGDPNSDKTRGQVTVKLVRPF